MSKFDAAIAAFDAYNAEDPNKINVDGEEVPKELHDALAMSRWIDALYPEASEVVKLAARCQHIGRWEIPRSDYPEGKVAYHNWRNALKKFHAEKSRSVLSEIGYDEATISKVNQINLKKDLRKDPEVQAIEDALCMVFLETQFEGYIDRWGEEKLIPILQKTWRKMSGRSQEAALKLQYSSKAGSILQKALHS